MRRAPTFRYLLASAIAALSLMLMRPTRALAGLSEEKLPSEDLSAMTPTATPTAIASPAANDDSDADTDAGDDDSDNDSGDDDSGDNAVTAATPTYGAGLAPAAVPSGAAGPAPTPAEPPPALDLSAASSAPDLGTESLTGEIRKAATPARAASLRLTEAARKELALNQTDAALRDLARAISIDGGNPFAYYYLGRCYLARRNYSQALTFFQHAELGFAQRPDWLGETLSYEGSCEEALGRSEDAAKAYQRAVAAAPQNFRAQAGVQRLGPALAPVANFALPPPPSGDAALPPPISAPIPPPEEEPTAAPPASAD